MNQPIFSILIPSIPSRLEKFLIPLINKLQKQIKTNNVEILTFIDNKKRSIGLKRDALLQIAIGKYLAFVDDDDDVSEDYVDSILYAIDKVKDVDIITFKQWVTINGGNKFTVDFSIEHEDNEAAYQKEDVWQDIKRKPFHICAWRREICQKYRFPDASYGEDWHWAKQVLEEVTTEAKIDKHLHSYRYSDDVTEAAPDFAQEDK